MGQSRLRNYKHEILSFDHNIFNFGMHRKGRYCGFEEMVVLGSVLQCNIQHSNDNAILYKDPVNTTHGPIGVIMTGQGDIIMEDDVIGPLEFDTNAGNSKIRYDLIILEHNHTVIAGGQDATYSIIKGPLEDSSFPALTNALKQVIVGYVEFPPGIDDLNNCIYHKAKCPDSGDGEDARINDVNTFKKTQVQKKSGAPLTNYSFTHTASGVDARLWKLPNDGNVYEILPVSAKNFDGFMIKDVDLQDGARIYLHCNENVTLRNTEYFTGAYGPLGYKPLAMPQGICNIPADAGFGALGVKPNVGEIWELEFVLMTDKWYLTRIGGAGVMSTIPVGVQMMWRGDTAANFETNGLGKNLMAGWHRVNGNGGTDDARGKYLAISDTLDGATDITIGAVTENLYVRGNPGTTDGETDFLILQTHLPAYNLAVTDPGHSHNLSGYYSDAAGGTSNPSLKGDTDNNSPSLISTTTSGTGITVNSGGGGTRLIHKVPAYFTILIQKI